MPDYWLKVPHLRQERSHTCTVACVRMVLAFHGREMPESQLAGLLNTLEPHGTLLRDVIAIESIGFTVTIGAGTFEDLQVVGSGGMPLITPVDTQFLPYSRVEDWGNHCIVVAGATATEVCILDPYQNKAPLFVTPAQFDQAWDRRHRRAAWIAPR